MATDRNDTLLGQILGALGAIGEQLGDIRDRLPAPATAGGEPVSAPEPEPEQETPVLLTEPDPAGTTDTAEADLVMLAEPDRPAPAPKTPATRRTAKKTGKGS